MDMSNELTRFEKKVADIAGGEPPSHGVNLALPPKQANNLSSTTIVFAICYLQSYLKRKTSQQC